MTNHYINISFDDKDTVKAKFGIKWDAARKQWYAEDAATAASAQAMATELSGVRDFAEREQAAGERNAKAAAVAAELQQVANALATLEAPPSLAELHKAKTILAQRLRTKFLVANDEKTFRNAVGPLAAAMGIECSTRNKQFNATRFSEVIGLAMVLVK